VIITADDFGLSEEGNVAILHAFDREVITHTSIMANMPSFESGCDLAREHGLVGTLGAHLVLTDGKPLTEAIRSRRRFCDHQGRFRYWRDRDRVFQLRGVEREAVARELRAQIVRCREQGLPVSHIDSHHNVHAKRAIAAIVIELARELQVPRVRLAHNCGPRIGHANRTYKAWINRRLRTAGLAGTRWYGSVEDYVYMKASGVDPARLQSFEVNMHPVLRDGILVDLAHPETPLEKLVAGLRS
jgi:predicted glycoside hydrolase/deacetylase ChbG (UPF0249 family)